MPETRDLNVGPGPGTLAVPVADEEARNRSTRFLKTGLSTEILDFQLIMEESNDGHEACPA